MEYDEYVAAVRAEIDGFVQAVAACPARAAVPTCPDWTVADLAEHVGQFCGFWTHVLCEGTGRPKTPFKVEPDGAPLAGWLEELGGFLVAELSATPSPARVWTWYEADQSAAFVARRSAHELAVHRYDAQSALGACRPIPRGLAADGIDEVLTVLVEARPRTGQSAGASMHVAATDAGSEWFVTLLPDRIDVERRGPTDQRRPADEHAPADLNLNGAASDLELLLYGRPTLGDVERRGDPAVLEAWRREFLF